MIITPKAVPPQLIVMLTASTGTAVLGVGQPVTFTATVTPATDGRTATARVEFIVSGV